MVTIDSIKKAILDTKVTVIHSKVGGIDYWFWKIDELDELNIGYKINTYLPGYFGIGTDYGG